MMWYHLYYLKSYDTQLIYDMLRYVASFTVQYHMIFSIRSTVLSIVLIALYTSIDSKSIDIHRDSNNSNSLVFV